MREHRSIHTIATAILSLLFACSQASAPANGLGGPGAGGASPASGGGTGRALSSDSGLGGSRYDASGEGGRSAATSVPVGGAAPCADDISCWPNASNTGYQNAPGYPGTIGVADPSKLTLPSANSPTCPPASEVQSNHTYRSCHFTGNQVFGKRDAPLTNVRFVGCLFETKGQADADGYAVILYCAGNCVFDYATFKPESLDAPDLPGFGTSYAKSYGIVMAAGWGAYYSRGDGLSITHSDLWGFGSGIILGGNSSATPILIEDNWIHDQADCPSGCLTHQDGIGMVDTGGSLSYVTINHNNMPFIQGNTNNIAFQQGTYDHIAVTNNAFSGDGYTVAIWDTSKNITFTGNVWTNKTQQFFQINYGKNFWDTPGSIWARNRFLWDPSGVDPFYALGPGSGNAERVTAADSGRCWVPDGLSDTDYGGGSCE